MTCYRKGEDWKGEDAISAKPKTPMERLKMTNSQAARMSHARRQRQGCNVSASGGYWARSNGMFRNHEKGE